MSDTTTHSIKPSPGCFTPLNRTQCEVLIDLKTSGQKKIQLIFGYQNRKFQITDNKYEILYLFHQLAQEKVALFDLLETSIRFQESGRLAYHQYRAKHRASQSKNQFVEAWGYCINFILLGGELSNALFSSVSDAEKNFLKMELARFSKNDLKYSSWQERTRLILERLEK